MKLTINKKSGLYDIYLKLIDQKRKSRQIKLNFSNQQCTIDIDLNKDKYLQFFYQNQKTDILILSENIQEITLKYQRKAHNYMVFFENHHSYGIIHNFTLKDEKNLRYRRDKAKKFHLLLPHDYDKKKKYGLILAFDGQNLFDQTKCGKYTYKNDPYGSWQIDESLNNLKKLYPKQEFIVCGMENADLYREQELSMNKSFANTKDNPLVQDFAEQGYIDNLDAFINETLFPYLCENYSLDMNNIGIMGSSAGGTACHYIGLKNYQKYQFILCHTPASGLYQDEGWLNFYRKLDFQKSKKLPIFYYFQGKKGSLEKLLYQLNQKLIDNLISANFPKENIITYIEPKANHNEVAWRYSFNYGILKVIHKIKQNETQKN